MKYKDTNFRAVYHRFVVVMLSEVDRKILERFPGNESADCILTIGYIDSEAGLTLEVLATGNKTGDGFRFNDGANDSRAMIRIGGIGNSEFYVIDDADCELRKKHDKKIQNLRIYERDPVVLVIREFEALDESRHEFYPDDILVWLVKKGLQPEGCWVRTKGVDDKGIIGTLLNTPDQDFGCHNGNNVYFHPYKRDDGTYACIANMDSQNTDE